MYERVLSEKKEALVWFVVTIAWIPDHVFEAMLYFPFSWMVILFQFNHTKEDMMFQIVSICKSLDSNLWYALIQFLEIPLLVMTWTPAPIGDWLL